MVERSVIFSEPMVIADDLEGEDNVSINNSSSPPSPPPPKTPPSKPIPIPTTPHPQRICKPLQYVHDIQTGGGSATGWVSRDAMPVGLQVPETVKENDETENEEEKEEEDVALVVDAGDIEPLEPKSLAEAKRRPEWPEWEKAIREELKTLKDAGTWELTDLPIGANVVGSKWVFRIKCDASGRVVRY